MTSSQPCFPLVLGPTVPMLPYPACAPVPGSPAVTAASASGVTVTREVTTNLDRCDLRLHSAAKLVRIRPSCTTETTSSPSAVNTSPRARPRPP